MNKLEAMCVLVPFLLLGGISSVSAQFDALTPKPGGGGGGAAPVALHLSLVDSELAPGENGKIELATSQALPLASGTIFLTLDPPLFVDNVSVEFIGQGLGMLYDVTPTGPGRYTIDFSTQTEPLNMSPGPLVSFKGTVDQNLPVGTAINFSAVVTAQRPGGLALGASAASGLGLLQAASPTLTLRIDNQTELSPGETITVEVRTYNPKPISEGQVCLFFEPNFFTSVRAVAVRSGVADVSYSTTVLPAAGLAMVQFSSPSATINSQDGPLLLLEMTVSLDVVVGSQTSVDIDLANTSLLDHLGNPVWITPRNGLFTIGP